MNDQEIDTLLQRAPAVPASIAEKIRAQVQRDTKPVKPLRSTTFYALLFILFFVAISEMFASALKLQGVYALPPSAALSILLALAILAAFGADTAARTMRPGAGRLYSWVLSALSLIAYEALVVYFFRDYSIVGFVPNGVRCLGLGVLCGAFVAVPMWFVLRRGLFVEPVKAGAAIGLVGGLAGLAALTLHCGLFTVPHAAVWHAGIVVVCTALGALSGRSLNHP